MQKQKKSILNFVPPQTPPFSSARMEILEDFLRESWPRRIPKQLLSGIPMSTLMAVGLVLFCVGAIIILLPPVNEFFTTGKISLASFFITNSEGALTSFPTPLSLLMIAGLVLLLIDKWLKARTRYVLSNGEVYSAKICDITPVHNNRRAVPTFYVKMEFMDEDKNTLQVKDIISQQMVDYLLSGRFQRVPLLPGGPPLQRANLLISDYIDVIYSPKYRRKGVIALKYVLDPPKFFEELFGGNKSK